MVTIETWLRYYYDIDGVHIMARKDTPISTSHLQVSHSTTMLSNPVHVKKVWVYSKYAKMSWAHIQLLMQHFRLVDNWFQQPVNNLQVMEELKSQELSEGLVLLLPSYEIEIAVSHSETDPLPPLLGLETVNSLDLGRDSGSDDLHVFPLVLQRHYWPELRYLALYFVNVTMIFGLKKTAPKLNYLHLSVSAYEIPDLVWTFDWDSLPWRTGFQVHYYSDTTLSIYLRGKIASRKVPPMNIFFSGSALDIDLGENKLTSLGYIMFTFSYWQNSRWVDYNADVTFKLDHNKLKSVLLYPRLLRGNGVEGTEPVRILDLSYNQLQGDDSDFLLLKGLRNLNLSNNRYNKIPKYTTEDGETHNICSLTQLTYLDLSHNNIGFDGVGHFPDLMNSAIRELHLSNNYIHIIPDSVYTAPYLTVIDLSYNGITRWPFVYSDKMNRMPDRWVSTAINLTYNNISHIWPDASWDSRIPIWKILENYNIDLEGNPLNCDHKMNRIYNYLISGSRSERPNLDPNDLPDFSFYDTQWKCVYPSQWAGIPLMQTPEYQYNAQIGQNCPKKCLCWRNGDVIFANCSHSDEPELPKELPDQTSDFNMSGNNLPDLCNVRTYLNNLKVLDVSKNKIDKICPQILRDLGNLVELNLTQNHLKRIPRAIKQMTNLTKLDLSNNQLQQLPKSIQKLPKLEKIDITRNKLRCDCDTFWMVGWLAVNLSRVEKPESLVCASGKCKGMHLIEVTQDDIGCYDPLKHALIGLGVTVTLAIILAIVIYRYRGHIKLWLFTRFGFHPWDRVKENLQEKNYDAFIAFCHDDDKWVFDTLMPKLEDEYGFHLCIHDRDFVPGAAITENIITAIESSRRVILVLTPNFVESKWCEYEFQLAHVRSVKEEKNFLIIVVLEEVDQENLDKALKLYMETNTYLKFDDNRDWFWKKMIYAMPEVPIDRLKAQQDRGAEEENDPNNVRERVIVTRILCLVETRLQDIMCELKDCNGC